MQESSIRAQLPLREREAGRMMSLKDARAKANNAVDNFNLNLFELLLKLNGYHVIGVLSIALSIAIDADTHNRILSYVSDISGGILSASVWKWALLLCGGWLVFKSKHGLNRVNIAASIPMIAAACAIVAYAWSGRPGEPSIFSFCLLSGMAITMLLFVLRTPVIEYYTTTNDALLNQVSQLEAKLQQGQPNGQQQLD